MLILRIKQAETALADGRLDEAFELVGPQEVRSHHRGQRLIGRLVRALVQRGKDHLADQRLQQALADYGKAQKLGGNSPQIAELSVAVTMAMEKRQQSNRCEALAVAKAKEHIDHGRLSAGQRLLGDISDNAQARQLLTEVAGRQEAVASAVKRAENALKHDDWEAAIDELLKVSWRQGHNWDLAELVGRVTKLATQQIRMHIEQGRVDLAESLLGRLVRLSGQNLEVQELDRIVQQCHRACDCVESNQPGQAAQILRRLGAVLPAAKWLNSAIGSSDQAAEGLEDLRAGPLGLIMSTGSSTSSRPETTQNQQIAHDLPQEKPAEAIGNTALPLRFIMQVDGAGSFLIVRQARLTVGPISSSQRPDVGLMADPNLPVATIERVDEDYFLRSDQPVSVNDKQLTSKLLANGDRIALAPRCRMKFSLPNPASTSAVLHLSGTRLPQGDIRRIILLDKQIILGAGPSAHITVAQLAQQVVLYVQNEKLFCRANDPVLINDRPVDQSAAIPMDVHVRMGTVSFIIKKV